MRSEDPTTSIPPHQVPAEADAGRLLAERYRLLEPIGRGGVAEVWRGRDERLGRPVAVKFLDAGTDDAFRKRFTEEARRSAAILHPNVVHVYDAADDDGRSFIVMELVDGRPLDVFMRERGPLALHHAARIVAQIAAGLDAAHAQGVVHCDVKPANVIIDSAGTAKLADFGIARAAEERGERRELVGTARYIAPEQVEGEAATPQSDIYSLGLLAFELIAGRPAFEGDDTEELLRARLVSDPPRPSHARIGVPPAVDAALQRAVSRNPSRRHHTAGEFAAALLAATERGDRTDTLTAIPLRRMPRLRVDPNNVILLIALALVGLGLYGFFSNFGNINPAAVEPIAVPAVTGQTFDQAAATLQKAGLVADRRDAQSRERLGIVIGQEPPAGATLRKGEHVALTVSVGLRAPNVIGKNCDEAVKELVAAGFGGVSWASQQGEKDDRGKVVRQEPAPDAQFQAGQRAMIWYVSGGKRCDGGGDDD
jgi:hypothetical protein